MLPDEVEDFRREAEARDWLRRGYTTAHEVNGLERRISAKRGPEAAALLVEEMRRQWKRRDEWMGEGNG
ncbi:hypothetical protein ACEK07_46045 [Alcanivoracaceae bacterium MT1]